MAHRRHSWAVGEAVHAPSVRILGFSSRRTMIMDERLRELDETRRKARHFGGLFFSLVALPALAALAAPAPPVRTAPGHGWGWCAVSGLTQMTLLCERSKRSVAGWDDSRFQPDGEAPVGTGAPSLRCGAKALFELSLLYPAAAPRPDEAPRPLLRRAFQECAEPPPQ